MDWKSINYISFVLENYIQSLIDVDTTCKFLTPLFKVINRDFCSNIFELAQLYIQIYNMYRNVNTVSQFMKAFRESIFINDFSGYPEYPPFIKFREIYLKAIEDLNSSYELSSRRSEILKMKNMPTVILNIITKYDFPEFEALTQFRLEKQKNKIAHIKSLSNNRFVTASEKGELRVWNSKTGKLLSTLKESNATYLTVLPNDLIVIGFLVFIEIWNPNTGKKEKEINMKNGIRYLTNFGNKIVVGTNRGLIRIWNPETENPKPIPEITGPSVIFIKSLSDGRIISGLNDGRAEILDSKAEKVEFVMHDRSHIISMNTTSNDLVITLDISKKLILWDSKMTHIVLFLNEVENFLITSNNKIVVVFSNKIQVYSEMGKLLNEITHNNPIHSIAELNVDKIIFGQENNRLSLWDLDTNKYSTVREAAKYGNIVVISVFPDGQIVTGSDNGYIGIWK